MTKKEVAKILPAIVAYLQASALTSCHHSNITPVISKISPFNSSQNSNQTYISILSKKITFVIPNHRKTPDRGLCSMHLIINWVCR